MWLRGPTVCNLEDWGKQKLSSKNQIVDVKGEEVENVPENLTMMYTKGF